MAEVSTVKITGIDGVLDTLKSLPKEVVSKRGGPVKLALAKGARFLRDLERQKFQQMSHPDEEDTGLLLGSIISSRGKFAGGRGEKYVVRIKRKSYNRKGRAVTTLKTAQIFEYGSINQPPRPFIRQTFAEGKERALGIVTDDLVKRVDAAVKKLSAKNKAR